MATRRVDAGRRLVEEGDLRPADEGERQRQALLLATRELAPGAPLEAGETDPVEQRDGVERVVVEGARTAAAPPRADARVHAARLQHDAHAPGQRGVVGDGIEPERRAPRRRRAGGSPRASRWSSSCLRRWGRARAVTWPASAAEREPVDRGDSSRSGRPARPPRSADMTGDATAYPADRCSTCAGCGATRTRSARALARRGEDAVAHLDRDRRARRPRAGGRRARTRCAPG